MACNKSAYTPVFTAAKEIVPLGFKRYNNEGYSSKIIQ
jgi:hypothetical protein